MMMNIAAKQKSAGAITHPRAVILLSIDHGD
jgi:hypothetical protein